MIGIDRGDGEVDREVREDRFFSPSLQVTVSQKRGGQHRLRFWNFPHFPFWVCRRSLFLASDASRLDIVSHFLDSQASIFGILYTKVKDSLENT